MPTLPSVKYDTFHRVLRCVLLMLVSFSARAGDLVFITAGDDPAAAGFVDEVSQQLRKPGSEGSDRTASISAASFRTGYAMARHDDDDGVLGTRTRGRTRTEASASSGMQSLNLPVADPPNLAPRSTSPLSASAFELINDRRPSLMLVAVGAPALKAAIESDVNETLVAVLLSREQLEDVAGPWLRADRRHRLLAIVTDQPLDRQLGLVQLALPRAERIGVVYTPDGDPAIHDLQENATRLRLQLVTARVNAATELKMSLDELIVRCDVLLVLSDEVSTAPGVGQVLLQVASHARLPVVAATESFVRSGAVVGVFSTRTQFARQAAESIQRLRLGLPVADVEIPRYFSVRVNKTVAQGLGLSLPPDASLEADLSRRR